MFKWRDLRLGRENTLAIAVFKRQFDFGLWYWESHYRHCGFAGSMPSFPPLSLSFSLSLSLSWYFPFLIYFSFYIWFFLIWFAFVFDSMFSFNEILLTSIGVIKCVYWQFFSRIFRGRNCSLHFKIMYLITLDYRRYPFEILILASQ